jgi:GxxExxY protein
MHADGNRQNGLSGDVIGGAFTVLNTLGGGLLGKVCENALADELRKTGLAVMQQRGVAVIYDSIAIGEYCVDLLLGQVRLIEL